MSSKKRKPIKDDESVHKNKKIKKRYPRSKEKHEYWFDGAFIRDRKGRIAGWGSKDSGKSRSVKKAAKYLLDEINAYKEIIEGEEPWSFYSSRIYDYSQSVEETYLMSGTGKHLKQAVKSLVDFTEGISYAYQIKVDGHSKIDGKFHRYTTPLKLGSEFISDFLRELSRLTGKYKLTVQNIFISAWHNL